MIATEQLNDALVEDLPELASDFAAYEQRRIEDPEFRQSFFSYSFIPTLQVALDRNLDDFCRRAFSLIERLLREGNAEVQAFLKDEFFQYGPACENWMKRAADRMGPLTREAARSDPQ